jgi:hypothetical protein
MQMRAPSAFFQRGKDDSLLASIGPRNVARVRVLYAVGRTYGVSQCPLLDLRLTQRQLLPRIYTSPVSDKYDIVDIDERCVAYVLRKAERSPLSLTKVNILLLEIMLRTNITNEESEGLYAANSEVQGPSSN